jgi:hypothetical protein
MTEDLLYVIEHLNPGDYAVIKNGVISKYYPDTQCVECDHYYRDELEEFNCMWLDIICPLDLPHRKYCMEYKPKE